jgi:hypothetical protein
MYIATALFSGEVLQSVAYNLKSCNEVTDQLDSSKSAQLI